MFKGRRERTRTGQKVPPFESCCFFEFKRRANENGEILVENLIHDHLLTAFELYRNFDPNAVHRAEKYILGTKTDETVTRL